MSIISSDEITYLDKMSFFKRYCFYKMGKIEVVLKQIDTSVVV